MKVAEVKRALPKRPGRATDLNRQVSSRDAPYRSPREGVPRHFPKVRTPGPAALLGGIFNADGTHGPILPLRALPRPSPAVRPLRPGPGLLRPPVRGGGADPLAARGRPPLPTDPPGPLRPRRARPPLPPAPQERDASGFTRRGAGRCTTATPDGRRAPGVLSGDSAAGHRRAMPSLRPDLRGVRAPRLPAPSGDPFRRCPPFGESPI